MATIDLRSQHAAHHNEDAAPARNDPSTRKTVVVPMLVGLVIGTFFVTTFLAAFHTPRPHDLPVGIVGTAQQVDQVEEALETNAAGTIAFTGYSSPAAAQDAVEDKQVYGAYLIVEDGTSAQPL